MWFAEGQLPSAVDNGECAKLIVGLQRVINRLDFFTFDSHETRYCAERDIDLARTGDQGAYQCLFWS